jgi:thiosulfate/3-mercaptopyruvate sulfurtransferase
MSGPLVSAAWLRERLDDPAVRVVDCRFRLGEPDAGERMWREGHIPGAAFLDVDRDLAAPPGPRGRHPLPDPVTFKAAVDGAGIAPETLVVAYDEAAEGGAARLWWLLRAHGHERAAVLDGGLRGWRAEGGELEAGKPESGGPPSRASAGEASAPYPAPATGSTIDAEELLAASRQADAGPLLLDARAPERYRGEVEPIDAVAGHIPGAVNLPFAGLAPEGRFLAPDELRELFAAAGVGPGSEPVAYCGSGVSACVLLLAAELAGIRGARLYPGSWSEWSGRDLAVERGLPVERD